MSARHSPFELLFNPRLNKGNAFTAEERERLGLVGLLPDQVDTPETQMARARFHLAQKANDLEKYIYLSELQDRNERLFYQLLMSDPAQYMPLVYTPTVGEACQKFGHIMRRPKGLYISLRRRGRIAEVLRNWPERDVRFIVVTDGERILGLGDLGACGMGIPVGKLALYTACAGVPPQHTLPVLLDMGTNNEAFLDDPLYPGLRVRRATGEEFDTFVEEFVNAVQEVFPRCCIQFEDFTNRTAMPLLERYRERVCCFNDDIQGTASVAVAGLLGASRILRNRLRDHTYLFFGAGSAAVGIADLVCQQMAREGLPVAEGRRRCWLVNSRGLVTAATTGLSDFQRPYAHEHPPLQALHEIVERIRPSALIGVSTIAKAFDERVIRAMAAINERPVIFPYSNPTSKSECTAQEAVEWSDGRAIFASGSPFAPLHHKGRLHVPGQGNNVYIYPAVGLAVFATEATRVTDEIFLRAAESLAAQTTDEDLAVNLIYPPVSNIFRTSVQVATDVAALIFERGLARVPRPADVAAFVRSKVYSPAYEDMTAAGGGAGAPRRRRGASAAGSAEAAGDAGAPRAAGSTVAVESTEAAGATGAAGAAAVVASGRSSGEPRRRTS
jgi:malate dehydrogenase (oxaloacetate-decarboxylating)(NADP+)